MNIFGNSLSGLIDQLEASIPNVHEGFNWGTEVERHDWRPVWALCKEIQSSFKGYKGFDTKEQHQAEWERFDLLRKKASKLADVEKGKFAAQSAQYKNEIIHEVRKTYWSMSADFVVGSILGNTTVDEMKSLQSELKEAGRKLSSNKSLMTRADKEECFEAIQQSRKSHDHFWEKYKGHLQAKQNEHEHKQEEFKRKRSEWLNRVHANISKNRDKLVNASEALERTRDKISDLENKLSETTSPKWEGLFSEWLAEARSKEASIEETIERISGWISEDEDNLRGS